MKNIMVINGPNLNMLGIREKNIYGTKSLSDINKIILERANDLKVNVTFFQSNSEGEIIDKIHSCYGNTDGIIINPGAYSHYSIAIYDALKSVNISSVEVHISNVFKREDMRSNMVTAGASKGVICGFGINSYLYALEDLANE